MQTAARSGEADPISHIITRTAAALSRRPGETQQQQQARAHTAATTIRQFQPRDVIEAMLAGHSVMFHCLMVDAVEDMTARGEPDVETNAASPGLIALNNAFHRNLDRFARSRKQGVETGAAKPREIVAPAEAALGNATVTARTEPPMKAAELPVAPAGIGPLPGLPAKLTPQQQLQAAVDGLRTGPPSPRSAADLPRSGVSASSMKVAAASDGAGTGRR